MCWCRVPGRDRRDGRHCGNDLAALHRSIGGFRAVLDRSRLELFDLIADSKHMRHDLLECPFKCKRSRLEGAAHLLDCPLKCKHSRVKGASCSTGTGTGTWGICRTTL